MVDRKRVVSDLRKLLVEHGSEALELSEFAHAILAATLTKPALEMLHARLSVFDFGALVVLDSAWAAAYSSANARLVLL